MKGEARKSKDSIPNSNTNRTTAPKGGASVCIEGSIEGAGLTIDNVPGPVFEGEDQQLWISGVGPASCQMWDVRPDPMF